MNIRTMNLISKLNANMALATTFRIVSIYMYIYIVAFKTRKAL
jgi:hypothetical protein